jgi:hypothetical protein
MATAEPTDVPNRLPLTVRLFAFWQWSRRARRVAGALAAGLSLVLYAASDPLTLVIAGGSGLRMSQILPVRQALYAPLVPLYRHSALARQLYEREYFAIASRLKMTGGVPDFDPQTGEWRLLYCCVY